MDECTYSVKSDFLQTLFSETSILCREQLLPDADSVNILAYTVARALKNCFI